MYTYGAGGEVPLHEQVCHPDYHTPEHKTTMPNWKIAERIAEAQEFASKAVKMSKLSKGKSSLEETLEYLRAQRESTHNVTSQPYSGQY